MFAKTRKSTLVGQSIKCTDGTDYRINIGSKNYLHNKTIENLLFNFSLILN